MLTVHLRDINADVVKAWELAFADAADVHVSRGDIFEAEADAVVSPANSFGFMDGGIDLLYSKFFGWTLQTDLQAVIAKQHHGELPVGQAAIVATGHDFIPLLVSAPTMRVPSDISATVNVYLAFRAALIAVLAHNALAKTPIRTLLAPGLGTGIGAVAPAAAAHQMRAAYDAIIRGRGLDGRGARAILRQHHEMLS
ncbi:macro domain-containing protein [Bradyrhizobium pachyrhizi]|uniref:macro domain-containing protein n=1 Tax=Bradyrhizobium pachyrhizi TaxID=280333 RepID=UPI0024B1AD95|nr:macro domain-containing protein [Bradyrhizobium pachyrhizi]WFU55824.1 macro domain-containing protein [Bradyrhizobium pachyrhizi]